MLFHTHHKLNRWWNLWNQSLHHKRTMPMRPTGMPVKRMFSFVSLFGLTLKRSQIVMIFLWFVKIFVIIYLHHSGN